jgi:hypothetical protein
MQSADAYRLIPLAPGTPGIRRTAEHMARFVRSDCRNQAVRTIAESIVSGCEGHDFTGEIEALFRYSRDQVVYRRDPFDTERVSGALGTVKSGVGDCDDKVVLLATLLCAMGHESRFVIISQTGRDWDHVYLEVRTSQGWQPADPTNPNGEIGEEPAYQKRWVFPIWEGGDANVSRIQHRRSSALRHHPSGYSDGAFQRNTPGLGAFTCSGSEAFDPSCGDSGLDNPYGFISSTGWSGGITQQVSTEFGSGTDIFAPGGSDTGQPCAQFEPGAPCTDVTPIVPPRPVPNGLTAVELCQALPGDCNYYVIDANGNVAGAYNPTTGAITPLSAAGGIAALPSLSGCGLGCIALLAIAAWALLS